MSEFLRARAGALVLIALALLLLSPTAVFRPMNRALASARIALAAGRPAAAAAHYAEVLSFEPGLLPIRRLLTRALLAASQPKDALEQLAILEDLTGQSRSISCLRRDAWISIGEVQRARSSWQEAGLACPRNSEFLLQVAEIELRADRPLEAENALREAAGARSWDGNRWHKLGLLALTRDPELGLRYLLLSRYMLHELSGIPSDLLRAIEDARAESNPAFTLATVGQEFVRQGQWDYAAWAFRNALAIDPSYAEARAYLGFALEKAGREGLDQLLAAARTSTDLSLPHLLLGLNLLEQGQVESAKRELEQALTLDPGHAAAAMALAQAVAQEGDLQTAEALLFRASELAPQDPQPWLVLAEFSLKTESAIKSIAIPAARNALVLDPSSAPAADLLGHAYYLLGNWPLAERLLGDALRLDPFRATTHYHLGLLRAAQGQIERAVLSLEQATRLDDQGSIGELAQRTLETLDNGAR